jgi:hypothetical protein
MDIESPESFFIVTFLPEIPGNTSALFWMWVSPGHSALIASKHTGTALDTVFKLEVNFTKIIQSIAICRTDVRRTFMRTC